MGSPEEERLLLEDELLENGSRGQYTGDGSVDINGKPVLKQNTGNWRACLFILGTEFCECLAFCGIAANLVTYLTRKLHEGNASAARRVTTWSGTRSLAPLIGAVLADSHWGRYWTIAVFSTIYFTDTSKNGVLAVQSLRNNIMASTLLASTAITLSSVVAMMMANSDARPSAIVFGARSELGIWIKFFSIMVCYLLAFLFNVQSIRYYSHASILINLPVKKMKSPQVTTEYVERAVNMGSYFWSMGLRAFYFSLPLYLWLFGPIPMFLCCVVLVFMLYFLDFSFDFGGGVGDGVGTLTLSASVPVLQPPPCVGSVCPAATPAQYAIFFSGLYLIALGTGGIKPCVSSFGADQFDDMDPREKVKKASFFNWFYMSTNIGALISSSFLVWIQENVGWGLGFGIPTLFMGLSIIIFFSGRPLYRFQKPGGSPLTRMCQVVVASIKKWNLEVPQDSFLLYELPNKTSGIEGRRKLEHSDELKCLDKAAVVSDLDVEQGDFNPWRLCTVTQVEELKILIRMFPIWVTGIVFSAVYTQMFTMFVEQGMVMDTTVGSFTIPPASLLTFDIISVIVLVPMYDRLLVPLARKFTGKERGFSELQRIGIGLFLSILSMTAAAIVEIKRLEIAKSLDLLDYNVAVPMSILWQIPQYFLVGAAEIFTFIGQLQFFYDQSPDAMRSLFSALSLLATALGNYLSSFILTIITTITTKGGSPGWIPNNLNEGHLDYYFWLLAGLGFLNMVVYVFCATRYKCKKAP